MSTPAGFGGEQGLPSPETVNAHLASKPNAPDESECAVPAGVPDHDEAMATGREAG